MVVYRLIEGTYVRGQISGFNLRPSLLALIELDCSNSTVRPSVLLISMHLRAPCILAISLTIVLRIPASRLARSVLCSFCRSCISGQH